MNSWSDASQAQANIHLPRSTTLGKTTLPAQIHGSLEEAIIRGEIAPSTRLNADDIAAHYGVSRIPVREALRSLHEAGWVDIRPRHGVYVRERSITELRELFEARSGIESQIAGLAADRRTDDELVRLRRIVDTGRAAARTGDKDATAKASIEFSETMRAACKNSVLAVLSGSLEKRARFYFTMVETRLGGSWVSVEMKLVDLIALRDVHGASAVARDHIHDTGAEVAKLLADQRFTNIQVDSV